MRLPAVDWSNLGWARVIAITALGTLFCVAAALYVDSFNFPQLTMEQITRSVIIDIVLPTLLAGPLLFMFTYKLRQLAIAHQQMSVLATTDSLTTVLNRGAFTMMVEAWLNDARRDADTARGALLVVDADHFKEINDDFGHQQGDVALRVIADSIKGELRSSDLVGRIGGEEFGIFLPGANDADARGVAERIRVAVRRASFTPADTTGRLSVSIGGATFRDAADFPALYRLADRRLYDAKNAGRDRIALSPLERPRAA